jgi:hypothetical protein
VSFEAPDDPLIHWLDMSCEIWLEICDPYILKTFWNNVAQEIVLQEQDFMIPCAHFVISLLKPFMIEG